MTNFIDENSILRRADKTTVLLTLASTGAAAGVFTYSTTQLGWVTSVLLLAMFIFGCIVGFRFGAAWMIFALELVIEGTSGQPQTQGNPGSAEELPGAAESSVGDGGDEEEG